MENPADIINLVKAKRLTEHEAELGAKVEDLLNSDGFLILKALLQNSFREIKDKEDYATLADFKADRQAIRIVTELMNQLEDMVNDGELAVTQLKKITENPSETPSPLIIEDEGSE